MLCPLIRAVSSVLDIKMGRNEIITVKNMKSRQKCLL
jgi:hypothetical protein